jgi:hypothetical protein
MTRFPDRPKLFVSIHCGPHRRQVAELFQRQSWQARECGLADFELTCPFAYLVVQAESPILVHGAVATCSPTDLRANPGRSSWISPYSGFTSAPDHGPGFGLFGSEGIARRYS